MLHYTNSGCLGVRYGVLADEEKSYRTRDMEFWRTKKSRIGRGAAESDTTFLSPPKLRIGRPNIHYLLYYASDQSKLSEEFSIRVELILIQVIL